MTTTPRHMMSVLVRRPDKTPVRGVLVLGYLFTTGYYWFFCHNDRDSYLRGGRPDTMPPGFANAWCLMRNRPGLTVEDMSEGLRDGYTLLHPAAPILCPKEAL